MLPFLDDPELEGWVLENIKDKQIPQEEEESQEFEVPDFIHKKHQKTLSRKK